MKAVGSLFPQVLSECLSLYLGLGQHVRFEVSGLAQGEEDDSATGSDDKG